MLTNGEIGIFAVMVLAVLWIVWYCLVRPPNGPS